MDPSVCRLHPGVAVTGFCPACLSDRLAGLQPPSSADLRRCKSFSYARSAAADAHSHFEPQRRSCDLFRQEPMAVPVPVPEEEEAVQERTEPSRKSFGGFLGKKLQQWRRKNKQLKKDEPMPPETMPGRHRQHSFRGRRSCDLDPSFSPRASWDARRLPPAMEEDMPAPVPRSDGQIPVEEDFLSYPYDNSAVPGGCAQTRDYYLDSSSSSRRRRSVDRSTASGRNSFSDANELPSSRMMAANNANARVSPAAIAAAEFYHAQSSLLVHHQYQNYNGSFGSASFRDHHHTFRDNKLQGAAANKPKKGIKGWSIWGLIHKKSSSSSRKTEADRGSSSVSAGVGEEVEYPWPELRARGYNGQILRCNSSISARSSFSGGMAAMIGDGSARRSISGMDMHDVNATNGSGRSRRDEVLLERNLSTRSRSGHDHPMGAANYQFSRPNHNGVPKGRSSKSSLPRRSTLGLYPTHPIPRQ